MKLCHDLPKLSYEGATLIGNMYGEILLKMGPVNLPSSRVATNGTVVTWKSIIISSHSWFC